MKHRIFSLVIVFFLAEVISVFFPKRALAASCGINIDPTNGAGYPSSDSLPGVDWVRIEYKDCTKNSPAQESVDVYRGVLSEYKNAGIKTLVILDYMTYPGAFNDLEGFAERTAYINGELGSLIDAYEIWNEPDIPQGGNLSPQQFANILDSVLPTLGGKTTVIGGLASGHPQYLSETFSSMSPNSISLLSAVGVHPYAKSVNGFPAGMTGDMGDLMNQYRALSRGKGLWITEIGIETTVSDQLNRYLDGVFQNSYGDPTFWFAWSDGMVTPFGIVDRNQQPKSNFANFFAACGSSPPSTVSTMQPITAPGGQGCGSTTGGNYPNPGGDGNTPVSNFYITPLEGLAPKENRTTETIRRDLVEQGYEAYCAMPTREISPSLSGQISEFFGEDRFDLNPIFMIDMIDGQNPIFRDTDRKGKLKADFEEYWSYQENSGADYSHSELGSAPIESLLTDEQKCTEGVKNLLAQDLMCQKLKDPNTCSLYFETVGNTSQTIQSLLSKYHEKANRKNPLETCKVITLEARSANKESQELLSSLSQIPLSINKSYRLAFILISISNLKERNTLFNFFAHQNNPRDEVLAFAFKIPDVITNKPLDTLNNKSSAYPGFSDGAMLTRDSLTTKKQQEIRLENEVERRVNFVNTFDHIQSQTKDSAVYCLDGLAPNGIGSQACNDELVKALTDMINAQQKLSDGQLSCVDDDKIDDVFTILDPSALSKIYPKPIFNTELGGDLLANLFNSVEASTGIDSANQTFTSEFFVTAQNKDSGNADKVEVNMYLVYPVGYEAEDISNVLSSSFLTKDQINALENDENLNERFEVQGGASSLTDNSHETKFKAFYPSWCDETNMLKCFRTTLEYSGKPIQIIGARLGYYMRAIQRTLAKEKSNVQEYLASCETVEEFLLDRCAGVGQKEPQSSITYCGMKELAITNSSTSQFTVCRTNAPAANCEPIAPGSDSYFLDRSSSHSLQIATRILDGATLITTGSVVTMSPGQDQNTETSSSRCGVSPENLGTGTQIWYLPPDVPESEIRNENTWIEKGSKFTPITGTKEWTNVVISLQVKPGYYMLPSETFGCLSRGASWAGKDGQESQERFILGSSVIPVGIGSKGRESYCAKATYNSNMPGGPGGDFYKTESYGCSINKPGFNLKLNNSCGGLNSSFENISFWRDLLSPDDENGSNKVPGLAMYEKMFGRKFVIPGGDGSCDSLFPNTIREVPCDQVDNNDVGTVANFGKEINFDIEYWSGSTINFKLPPQEVWSAINAASAKHFCDPYLVLAVANSESPTYSNTSESSAGALGVFQFIPGFTPEGKRRSWETWKVGNAASASCVNQHQPPTFTGKTDELSFSSPTDIPSAADSACRLILWTGAQRHLDDKQAFINAFSIQGENAQNQIWNNHTPQAEYVWRLWNKLLSETGKTAIPQPADYPPNCGQ